MYAWGRERDDVQVNVEDHGVYQYPTQPVNIGERNLDYGTTSITDNASYPQYDLNRDGRRASFHYGSMPYNSWFDHTSTGMNYSNESNVYRPVPLPYSTGRASFHFGSSSGEYNSQYGQHVSSGQHVIPILSMGINDVGAFRRDDIDENADNTEDIWNESESDDPDFVPSASDDDVDDNAVVDNTSNNASRSGSASTTHHQELGEMMVNEDDIHEAQNIWEGAGNLKKGLIFSNKDQVVDAIRKCCLRQRREYIVEESKKDTIAVICKLKSTTGCRWRCRATRRLIRGMKWEIMNFEGEHSCLSIEIHTDHAQLSAAFISREVEEQVGEDPTVKIKVLALCIKNKYGFQPSYRKTWQAKEKAIAKIHGDWDDSYEELPRYLNALQMANPGTVYEFMHGGTSHDGFSNVWTTVDTFRRVFWSFKSSIDGFKFCRPVLLIDATFLYGKYRGNLMIASGVDGANHILPVAFAIVEKESEDTWEWFLGNVKRHVTKSRRLCIISDRHQGIKNVLELNKVWTADDGVHHRFCLRHIAANVKKHTGINGMQNAIFAVGSQYQVRKFHSMMEKLGSDFPEALQYISEIPVHQWSAAYDNGFRFGIMSTNTAECMNGILKKVRHLPITAIVRKTFEKVNDFFNMRRNEYSSYSSNNMIYPKCINRLFERRIRKAGFHRMVQFDNRSMICSVETGHNNDTGRGGNIQLVNLTDRVCSCGKFQGRKIPCSHVIAACRVLRLDWSVFVGRWYTMDLCHRVYEVHNHPVPHEAYWPPYDGHLLQADSTQLRRIKGRPKSSRYRNEMDNREAPTRPLMCSICIKLAITSVVVANGFDRC